MPFETLPTVFLTTMDTVKTDLPPLDLPDGWMIVSRTKKYPYRGEQFFWAVLMQDGYPIGIVGSQELFMLETTIKDLATRPLDPIYSTHISTMNREWKKIFGNDAVYTLVTKHYRLAQPYEGDKDHSHLLSEDFRSFIEGTEDGT